MEKKLNVLMVHNYYKQRGGEDAVVESEVSLLKSYGHHVETYFRHNDEVAGLTKFNLGIQTIWSGQTKKTVSSKILAFKPDVIHVHNTFPLISPSLYWAASNARVPVVQTLHNFRLLCPQAMFLRENKVCEACLGHLPIAAVKYGCYRESRVQTAVLSSMLVGHRVLGTWANKVDRFIALNKFCQDKFVSGGLPKSKFVIKPNFVEDPHPEFRDGLVTRHGFLFVGRLSAEKGVATLGKVASILPHIQFDIAGHGDQAELIANKANISMLGMLNSDQVKSQMQRAKALIIPSIWYENFPRTLVESFANGLPVIASRIGALADIVQDGKTGLLFDPLDAEDLAEKIRWVELHPREMEQMGKNAREQYEREFSPQENYKQLIKIYEDLIFSYKR